MSKDYEYKLGVTLSESVIENFVRRPLAGKPPYEYKLGVTLSESVIENFVRRPLAEESP